MGFFWFWFFASFNPLEPGNFFSRIFPSNVQGW
jgi:hypothetical protein